MSLTRFVDQSCYIVQKCMPGTQISCFSVDFPFVLAPLGFVRLWEVLEGFGKLWEALEDSASFARFCKALGGFVAQS